MELGAGWHGGHQRPSAAGRFQFYAGYKVKNGLVAWSSRGWSSPTKTSREMGQHRCRKGRLRTRGLHRRFPALERWQVLRVLNVAEVGQQSLLGLPGVLGQVPEQGQAYARIEVLLSEDPADELLELKLQKLARSGRGQGWLSRVRHCRRSGVPLLVVSR
jgi:hypothetical protein